MRLIPSMHSFCGNGQQNLEVWLPLIVALRVVFRFLIFLDLELFPVFFLNIPLLSKMPRGFLLPYLLGMFFIEVDLLWTLRKEILPLKPLLVYFGTATVLEFPYALFKGLLTGYFDGIFLFVLPWYLSALAGLVTSLKLLLGV